MRLIRVSYRLADGSIRNSQNWYIDFTDHNHRRHRIAAFANRNQSQRFGEQIEHLATLRMSGDPLDAGSLRWLRRLPEVRQRQLADLGLINGSPRRPGLLEQLDAYQQSLIDRGMKPADAREAANRCRRTIKAVGVRLVDDLTPTAVQAYLAGRRREGLSPTTSNHYLKQLKAFCNWLVREGKAAGNPLAHTRKVTEAQDTQRAFTPSELGMLLETTWNGPSRFGMTGRQRYWLYRFAAETGLRAGEIRRLKLADFDWQARTVTIRPPPGRLRPKVQKLVKQPLRRSTAIEMSHLLTPSHTNDPPYHTKESGFTLSVPDSPVFKVPAKAAAMLALDLADAGIPREDAEGRPLVFHSFRHTFGTNLIAAGVDLATVQKLMRHSTIQMTVDRYGHVPPEAAQAAVERLCGHKMPTAASDTPQPGRGPENAF